LTELTVGILSENTLGWLQLKKKWYLRSKTHLNHVFKTQYSHVLV